MPEIYPICPVPKPRMTMGDRRAKNKVPRPAVARYWAFRDECRLRGLKLPESGASVTFVLPMPKSWPKKKRDAMRGQGHRQRPDLSNLLKALEDSVHDDDSGIWNYAGLEKIWGDSGAIVIDCPGP